VFWWNFWSPSCSNFIMFGPYGGCLVYNSTNFPNLLIIFPNFLHITLDVAWINTSFNCKPPPLCMHTSNWPFGYSPFTLCSQQWMHGDPWCNSQHFCCNYARYWFIRRRRTITCTSFSNVQFFLLMNHHCAYQRWNLHLSWHCHSQCNVCGSTSSILHNSKICDFQCNSSKRQKLPQPTHG